MESEKLGVRTAVEDRHASPDLRAATLTRRTRRHGAECLNDDGVAEDRAARFGILGLGHIERRIVKVEITLAGIQSFADTHPRVQQRQT